MGLNLLYSGQFVYIIYITRPTSTIRIITTILEERITLETLYSLYRGLVLLLYDGIYAELKSHRTCICILPTPLNLLYSGQFVYIIYFTRPTSTIRIITTILDERITLETLYSLYHGLVLLLYDGIYAELKSHRTCICILPTPLNLLYSGQFVYIIY